MNCEAVEELLSDLIDDELGQGARTAVLEHLASCEECAAAYKRLARTVRFVRTNGTVDLKSGTPGSWYAEFTRALVDPAVARTGEDVMHRVSPRPRRRHEMKSDVVIIGGGVAGLATGALLANGGRKVTVLERGNQPGGRAYCYEEKGFTLNYGPHGTYRPHSGFLGDILRRLGRPPIEHGLPEATRSYWSLHGRFGSLGAKPHQVLTTPLFPISTRLAFARLMLKLRSLKPESAAAMTWGEWIDAETSDPMLRDFLRAFATVNTYSRPSRELSAGYVLAHLQRNAFSKDFVGYMNGGWRTMYEIFVDEIRAGGGELRTGVHVDRLEVRDGRVVAAIAGDTRHEADAFVCTLPPDVAPALAEAGTPLAAEMAAWPAYADVRATTMDLGFNTRLRTDLTFIFDVERDLYFSIHSEVTPDLAPPGSQLLHAMAYLSPEESADQALGERRRQDLLDALDNHFAGWRDALVVERTLTNVRVQSVRRTPEHFGAGVPLRAASVANLLFAGDGRDLPYALATTSLASAIEVADAVLAEAETAPAVVSANEPVPA
jgi:phytoene dehydrogenase-like protein